MKIKLLSITVVAFIITSCSPKVYNLQGNYPSKSREVNLNFETVWSKTVDFLTTKEVPIKLIDKSTGLITTENINLTNVHSVESEIGEPKRKDSYVVVGRVSNIQIYSYSMKGAWTLRVTKVSDSKTLISLILSNASAFVRGHVPFGGDNETVYIPISSTGVFENELFDFISNI